MSTIERLDDISYEGILLPVWEYLAVEHTPKQSEVIFVFGGIDFAVPAKAAELYSTGLAPSILITGNAGKFTKEVFSEPEAYVFQREVIKHGVPVSSIIIEDQASNTGENVAFGMKRLIDKGIAVNHAILVAKPFLMRRCIATFQNQYPNIDIFSCPPNGSIFKFIDRPRDDFAGRLLAELRRLEDYHKQGYITKQIIPKDILEAAKEIRKILEQQ